MSDANLQTIAKGVPYSDEELEQRSHIICELNDAYNQRQQRYTELDDMTYDQWYIENKKAASGYVKPRTNPHDVRTNSGVIREKTTSLLSNLLDYDFEPDIEAFDEYSQPDKDFSSIAEDMVKRSREIEKYDEKRPIFYKEYCDQGNLFVWERFVEMWQIEKKIKDMSKPIDEIEWDEEEVLADAFCSSEMVSGLNVFLGNIREYDLKKQPYIAFRFERTRAEVKSVYGKLKNWKYVPKKIQKQTLAAENNVYEDWSMIETQQDMCEEIHYFNPWKNTYQVMLNGVMMLPAGFPLSFVSGGRIEYPIAEAKGEPINVHFAYCRSIPAKNKFNQQMMDEFYRAMILKTRQSYNPPMADNTGKNVTSKIFYPGTIHKGLQVDKLRPIIESQGVTSAEFNMMQFVKGVIDDASVSPIFEGNSAQGKQTATETLEMKKQTMMKLGVTLLGIINFEKQMTWNRLYNIIQNWTEPLSEKMKVVRDQLKKGSVYRSETVNTQFEDGQAGKRIIEFTDEVPHPDQSLAESEMLTKRRGEKIHKVYIDPKKLKEAKYKYYIEIVPGQKRTSELRKMLFEQTALKLLQMFPETANKEYIAKRIAVNADLDPDKVLIKPQQGMAMPNGQSMGPGGPQGGMPPIKPPQAPSINTLMQQ